MIKATQSSAADLVTLPRSFYERSARDVAPDLLGHLLLRRTSAGWTGGPIVEVEAYLRDDAACHAVKGPTRRNTSMFGPGGKAYVYFIYGVHYCVNAVCMPPGIGEAVLIRAIEPAIAPELMMSLRKTAKENLANGPGKLCSALNIDRRLDGEDLCDVSSELIIALNSGRRALLSSSGPIVVSKRIGITKASDLPLRFCLERSGSLSRPARWGQ